MTTTASAFSKFTKLVATAFQDMAKTPKVFVAGVEKDALWEAYLAAFPAGTDPVFKKRTEHDCSCCRHFIRRARSIVAVDAGSTLRTVWDAAAEKAPYPYDVVATRLRDLVKGAFVSDLYRVGRKEASFGAEKTRVFDAESQRAVTWDHLYTGPVPEPLRVASPDADRGAYRTAVEVFERGLTELDPGAVDTVLSLILDNGIYRGQEHKGAVLQFQAAQTAFRAMESDWARNVFVWTNVPSSDTKGFRNTAIGTLVVAITEGTDVEDAVKMFESMVAPANYKRPKAVITPRMVAEAMKVIEALDLEPALERRLATMGDVSVRDVLWVDGAARPLMKGGGLGAMLMKHAVAANPRSAAADEERAEEIHIDAFVKTVLPQATGMELLFRGDHMSNLMVLTAPVHPEPKQIFRWDNDFAWSYHNNLADSAIRQAVQARGGRVDGVFRFSHQWNHEGRRNTSLMDLHVYLPGSNIRATPPGTIHNEYGNAQRVNWNHRSHHSSGGVQDVDYTAQAPYGFVPVENITFPDIRRMPEGQYVCKVHNWNWRVPTEAGFRAEIEFGGKIFAYDYPKPLQHHEWVTVATVTLKGGEFTIEHHLPHDTAAQEKWGLTTNQYVRVSAVTFSPNYWGDNATGNRHTFFVLDGAKCAEPMRGIYNEFLHPRLEPHRKVFETIGQKTMCAPTDAQVAGVGFSSTTKANFIVKVQQGKRHRIYNVRVGA